MADNDWRDMLAAERMRVDQRFEDQVEASSFSRQQWGLVMTAVEFDVENPDDPEQATLVADASKLPSVMPQIKQMEKGGGMSAASGTTRSRGSGGGFFSKITSALSLGGGSGGKRQQEAEDLADQYAKKLQERLEKRDRWRSICEKAARSD